MQRLTKEVWGRVTDKACEIANAAMRDDAVMLVIRRRQMLGLLDELEKEFGVHPEILDTRADYLEEPAERRRIYLEALALAQDRNQSEDAAAIRESLKLLDEEMAAERRARSEISPIPPFR